MADDPNLDLQTLTADIVSAYVTKNKVEPTKLGEIIGDVHRALSSAGHPAPAEPEGPPKPDKAAIRKSMTPDYLVSFEDDRHYKSLKRHLSTAGLTPDEYRSKWGLPKDYPTVAPNYSAQRSALAKTLGLGRKAAQERDPDTTPLYAVRTEVEPEKAKPAKKGRGKAIKPTDETVT